jgi:hypothetical protein
MVHRHAHSNWVLHGLELISCMCTHLNLELCGAELVMHNGAWKNLALCNGVVMH